MYDTRKTKIFFENAVLYSIQLKNNQKRKWTNKRKQHVIDLFQKITSYQELHGEDRASKNFSQQIQQATKHSINK